MSFLSKQAYHVYNQEMLARVERLVQSDATTKKLAPYRNNPARFVLECIDCSPAPYQIEILDALAKYKRVAVRGPHGLGKTCLAAWLVIWGVLTAEDAKLITTASAWRQLTKYLWPEIHKWVGKLKWRTIGRKPFTRYEQLTMSLKLSATQEAFAVASDDPALIEGAHARTIGYIFDEAKAIPDATWDAVEGAFSGAGEDTGRRAYALAISTPGNPQGRFYDIHTRKAGYEEWYTRHVTLEEAIDAGRISRDWAEKRKRQWGEASAVYQTRVLGNFAASEEESVIPLAWVEAAIERWHVQHDSGKVGDFVGVGVDVGRGGDPSVLALRFGNMITELREYQTRDTMMIVGYTKGIIEAHGGVPVVDVIGVGAGVVDRLRESGIRAVAFNAGAKTSLRDKSGELGFADTRSAAWWNLRELLDPRTNDTIALPPNDNLIGELTAPRWRVMSGGKIKVESKDEVKKRLRRSTDNADAVIQIFWNALPQDFEVPAVTQTSRFDDVTSGLPKRGSRWKDV